MYLFTRTGLDTNSFSSTVGTYEEGTRMRNLLPALMMNTYTPYMFLGCPMACVGRINELDALSKNGRRMFFGCVNRLAIVSRPPVCLFTERTVDHTARRRAAC